MFCESGSQINIKGNKMNKKQIIEDINIIDEEKALMDAILKGDFVELDKLFAIDKILNPEDYKNLYKEKENKL
jgi:hypothetical protein